MLKNTSVFIECSDETLIEQYPVNDDKIFFEEFRDVYKTNKNVYINKCFDGNTLNNLISKIAFYSDEIIDNIFYIDTTSTIGKIFEKYNSLDKMTKFLTSSDEENEIKKKYLKYKQNYLLLKNKLKPI